MFFPGGHLRFWGLGAGGSDSFLSSGSSPEEDPQEASVTILVNAMKPCWDTALPSKPGYHPMGRVWSSLHILQEFRERRDG